MSLSHDETFVSAASGKVPRQLKREETGRENGHAEPTSLGYASEF